MGVTVSVVERTTKMVAVIIITIVINNNNNIITEGPMRTKVDPDTV